MSTQPVISGKKREQLEEFSKKVGLYEAKVIAINPSAEEFKTILGIDLKEDSKATNYLGESKDNNTQLRVDIWMEAVKTGDKFKTSFFLENKVRENKDNTKTQYINTIGSCSWAEDENDLPDWFKARDYRKAYSGEEELYNFIKMWQGNLDPRDAEAILQFEWKKLMKGNVSDIKSLMGGEFETNFLSNATIKTVVKDGETTEYQSVWNKGFLPLYTLKQFRLVNYDDEAVVARLKDRYSKTKGKGMKIHEKFVATINGEHGCKEYFLLKELQEYNPEMNLVSSEKPISREGFDY